MNLIFFWTKRPLKEEKLKDKISIRNETFVRQIWDKLGTNIEFIHVIIYL